MTFSRTIRVCRFKLSIKNTKTDGIEVFLGHMIEHKK